IIAVGIWVLLFHLYADRKSVVITSYAVPAMLTCVVTYQGIATVPGGELKQSWRFASGGISLAEGFQTRKVTSGIPEEIRRVIGTEARVYTLDHLLFTMAPGCELESFVSFSMDPNWHTIHFESPERAREVLQKGGLNYFLIDLNAGGLDILQ